MLSGARPQQKSIKVTQDMSPQNTTENAQVTIRMLAAHSPEYSVPLTAAVTHAYFNAYNLEFISLNFKTNNKTTLRFICKFL